MGIVPSLSSCFSKVGICGWVISPHTCSPRQVSLNLLVYAPWGRGICQSRGCPGAVERAGVGGEGSTPKTCQIAKLPPGDANNNITKCSSKNWNTWEDDLVTDQDSSVGCLILSLWNMRRKITLSHPNLSLIICFSRNIFAGVGFWMTRSEYFWWIAF